MLRSDVSQMIASIKVARSFVIVILAVCACEDSAFASSAKVNAVLRNETQNEIKVRIQSTSGYSAFGISPRNVFTEYVDRAATLTITMQGGRILKRAPLIQRGDLGNRLDVNHDAVYVRITKSKIELVIPGAAEGWWEAGLHR
jgi:hypothetical protein